MIALGRFMCAVLLVPKLAYKAAVLGWIGHTHPDASQLALEIALLRIDIEELLGVA